MMKGKRRLILILIGLTSPILLYLALNFAFPLDLSRVQKLSTEITDSKGQPLRIYLSPDGYLRLPVTVNQVDPHYIKMLIAYEDKRFYRHFGVDPLALIRAGTQALTNGRVISGGSTLTMQTARLLEPRERNLSAKIIEIFRAFQLEQKFSKDEILSLYLTLAPFGGNREGIRAATLTYFNRPPQEMTAGEAALLVALPQSPSLNRPDRYPDRARAARDKILKRVRKSGAFKEDVIDIALSETIASRTYSLPILAPHLADRLKRNNIHQQQSTWIQTDLQRWSETYIRQFVSDLPAGSSAALLVVENKTRHVISYVGSAHYQDEQSDGYVDMISAIRSPGSTLKPLIYGLAMDDGIAHPQSRIHDVPTSFGDYQPKNFRDHYYGDISLADALQLSLNVPAVIALERIGPGSFTAKMRRLGMSLQLPDPAAKPGLAIALGGIGTNLESLVLAYRALADDGQLHPLEFARPQSKKYDQIHPAFLNPRTLRNIAHILRGVRAPSGLLSDTFRPTKRDISYKTGTSYGFRDAWAVGYNRDYTVGIWVGKADGTPNPGHYGASTAAPLLFQVFDRLPDGPGAHTDLSAGINHAHLEEISPALKRFDRQTSKNLWQQNIAPPQITYPISGALVELPEGGQQLVLKAEGGKRPFTWVINGSPVTSSRWSTQIQWRPEGPGFAEITLIDALGRHVTSDIRVQ